MRFLTLTSSVLRATLLPLSSALVLVACANGGDTSDGGAGSDASFDGTHFKTPDGGTGVDTGTIFPGPPPDGSSDTGGSHSDAARFDGGAPDATTFDAHAGDAGLDGTAHDTGMGDGSVSDAPKTDVAAHDAGHDAGGSDAAPKDAGTPDVHVPDGGCGLGHLVISQVKSRGLGGGNDEFIDLFNPTGAAVALDATWVVDARSNAASSFTSRWKGGSSASIPAQGHYLLGGSAYASTPAADAPLSSGVTDASSVRLTHGGTVVDVICYAYSASTKATLSGSASYDCPGTPATNPHNDTSSTDVNSSLERAPGGAAGNCTDTGNSSQDFMTRTPSDPYSSTSAPTP